MAAVLFTDLVGSTELLSRLGDAAFDGLRRAHFAALREAIARNGGTEVKSTGDGLLATFSSAADAVGCAVGMQQAVDVHRRAAGIPLAIRVGVSLGDVSFEEGDVYGTPVVEAARLVAAAQGGQILATSVVRLVAGGRSEAVFADLGCLELKGLPAPVAACAVGWEPLPVAAAPLPELLSRPGRIFVGRDGEMARLQHCWTQATDGEVRCVLVAGEPGIGKTRLAAELAARVHADGATVLAGRCDEDLGVPYQPFVEALRHVIDHTEPDALSDGLGRYRGELVRLVPELADRLPDLAGPLRSDPETERYRLFDAVAGWLTAATADRPVLLVLDDLQWAARPTLLLLRHVLRSSEPMRLLVVATYRDTEVGRTHPLGQMLADVRRLENVERVSLPGLDEAAVTALLKQAAGHELGEDGDLARVIHGETEGNAFFVREIIRHLVETGGLVEREGRWVIGRPIRELGIPEGVRDVVGRRLSRLSARANEALAVGAVGGDEFEFAVVQEAGRWDEDTLVAALDEAVTSRLLREIPGPGSRFRFAHALVRSTLYDELSSARRAALHRRVAEAIESVHAGHLDDHLPALAHHFARASAPQAVTDKSVSYATRAGDRALAQLAHDQAVAYYRQALEIIDLSPGGPEDPRRLELLISLGEAQRRVGDPGHRETLLEAARLAQERGDADALARAALANNRGFYSDARYVDDERVAVLTEALSAMPGDDSALRCRLLANLAGELIFSQESGHCSVLMGDALAMARRLGDPATLGHVLAQGYLTLVPDADALRAHVDELTAVAVRLGDPALAYWAALWGSLTHLVGGDAGGALSDLDDATHRAEELRQPAPRILALLGRANLFRLAGRLASAEESADEALALGRSAGIPDAHSLHSVSLFWLRHDQGRCGELVQGYARAAARSRAYPLVLAYFSLVLCELERHPDLRRVVDALDSQGVHPLQSNIGWLYGHTLLATVCAQTGDAARAAPLYDRLGPHRGLVGTILLGTTGTVDHHLGLLAGVLGRYEEADAHFAAAAGINERMGAPVLQALTWLEHGRMLVHRGRAGDTERTRELLGQALATARELGLANVERRSAALLKTASEVGR